MNLAERSNSYTIRLNNISVHYEWYENKEANDKPVFTLIHGFLSSTFSYRRLIPLLNRRYNVLALDLPPFGKSQKTKKFEHSYQNLSQVVIKLLENLAIEKSILIGHSMGGQIALNIAKNRPDLVSRLILLSSSGYMERSKLSLVYSSYLPFFSLGLKKWLEKQGVRKNLLNCVSDPNMIDEEMIQGYLQPFNDDNIFKSLTRMIRDREGDLSSEELKKITIPSLLIWGKEDRVVPLKIGKRLNRDLPNSKLIVYENTGHLLPEEKPNEVLENILSFINT
ncbi:alpha/beta fold hydrolase [Pseudalkalibacillus caeni]|uniref:Alpha/beta hydrolase n=1 Tax=Exobacillus caeni TaxID=2574798 RepID=A0A5R9F1U3_9BACL|nr:alpha/beta hydrolase [Pseudalkalibacillus caeni]TLS36430.1 alpha/beta hydrolase [Pseudalkalibacillus caeni]